MPRPARADEAGGLYQALNRGKLRTTIFHQEGDIAAFEKILSEGLETYQVELFSYQLMPNHYHLVLRPLVDGEMSGFMKWIGGTHTMRYHAHYHTGGLGDVYQLRYKSFPIQDGPSPGALNQRDRRLHFPPKPGLTFVRSQQPPLSRAV